MNKISIVAYVIAVSCFSACSNGEQDRDSNFTKTDTSNSAIITSDPQNLKKSDNVLSDTGKVIMTPMVQTVFNQPSSTTIASGLNPPHGEPGHRCDIAVGAPLNSPAKQPATQIVPMATTPAVPTTETPAQKATVKTVTPAGMNPPHGEPGHRCDIAVGQPLNSPVTNPSKQIVAPTQIPAPLIPPKKDSGS